jgi:hypothetical protein
MIYPELLKKSLKIPKKVIRSRRLKKSDNTMAKRKRTKGHTLIYKTASPVLVLNTHTMIYKTASIVLALNAHTLIYKTASPALVL